MLMSLSWSSSKIAFKAITTVKELAYVSTNVVFQHKTSTWMLADEAANIQDKFI